MQHTFLATGVSATNTSGLELDSASLAFLANLLDRLPASE